MVTFGIHVKYWCKCDKGTLFLFNYVSIVLKNSAIAFSNKQRYLAHAFAIFNSKFPHWSFA